MMLTFTSKGGQCWKGEHFRSENGETAITGSGLFSFPRSLFSPQFSLHYQCDGKNFLHTKIPSLLSSLVSFRLWISLPCTILDPGGKFAVTIKHSKNTTKPHQWQNFPPPKTYIHKIVRNSSSHVCCLFWNYFNNLNFLH